MHFKDTILDALASRANVAQFVSYSPELVQRFSRVSDMPANHMFDSIQDSAVALLTRSADRAVNVRSFHPADPKSREFVYGLRTAIDVEATVQRLATDGLFTIVNETIDIHDGGVSGVALGDLIEFAPDDTPRCVEKPGTAAFPVDMALRFLQTVYGFRPELDFGVTTRVEFSIHPLRRGVRQEHQIIWELEEVGASSASASVEWPNRFSQLVGDKVFGLLVAHLFGLPVPKTTVISRRLAPFSFGKDTGTREPWLRTSPRIQIPGKFPTQRGWTDPFLLLNHFDADGSALASVVMQEGVDALYSGAAMATANNDLLIEGTAGYGDEFMVGLKERSVLPDSVKRAVRRLYRRASARLGPVRFEWVSDSNKTWIVQFHRGPSPSFGRTIYPGTPPRYLVFDSNEGLEKLRNEIERALTLGVGIELVGDVGITSHFGDVLRKARIPSFVTRPRDVTAGTG